MRHSVLSRQVILGSLLALATAVYGCDLSPQPLPPREGNAGVAGVSSGTSLAAGGSADASASAGGMAGVGSSGSLAGSGSSAGAAGGGNLPPTTAADAGSASADAAGPDSSAAADAGGGSDARSEGDSGDAALGDGAAADGGTQSDGGTEPDGGTEAGCDSGCSRQASATHCSAPKVEWVCAASLDRKFENACGPALAGDPIRYCCSADFLRQCP